MRIPSDAEAEQLVEQASFIWHQRFALSPNVEAPGINDVAMLTRGSGIPDSLDGATVLDIGTTNGGMAFECERRGASRVVAVDIYDAEFFGFDRIAALLESRAEFVKANLYELPQVLDETFDLVVFWGVLYHLRHPLLGLDTVRRLAHSHVSLETAVCDWQDGSERPIARFHRSDDLGDDCSNWWTPSTTALREMVCSAGFTVMSEHLSPAEGPAHRALVDLLAVPGLPEFRQISYEPPLQVRAV